MEGWKTQGIRVLKPFRSTSVGDLDGTTVLLSLSIRQVHTMWEGP